MGAKTALPEKIKVAVPFYGCLFRPGKGMEKIYFVVEVERNSGSYGKVSLQIWNSGEEGGLVHWLSRQKIQGLVCSDRHKGFETALLRNGIRVCWGSEGELEEMIAFWNRAQAA